MFITIFVMVGLGKWNVRIDWSVFYFVFDWAWVDWISGMEELIVLLIGSVEFNSEILRKLYSDGCVRFWYFDVFCWRKFSVGGSSVIVLNMIRDRCTYR